MTFEFEGKKYRIAFAHDKSRDWAAHEGHDVRLTRPDELFLASSKPVAASHSVALFCVDCEVLLPHVPKSERVRATRCMIAVVEPLEPGAVITHAELMIYRDAKVIAEGRGRCSPRDHWTREGGRRAALANALEVAKASLFPMPHLYHQPPVDALAAEVQHGLDLRAKAFRAAAWAAYNNRARKEAAA